MSQHFRDFEGDPFPLRRRRPSASRSAELERIALAFTALGFTAGLAFAWLI